METIKQQILTGERALFQAHDLNIEDSIFEDGESPLKHSRNIHLLHSMFKWKYPLWYSDNIQMEHCTIFEMGRAGIWYTKHITVADTIIEAPKMFRRCEDVTLRNVTFPNAEETLWNCQNLVLSNISAKGDYFGMNCTDAKIDHLQLVGNYSFDGAQNLIVEDSALLTKDAFWNCENITVRNSFISGEYFGWNSRNITLENCTVESLQGFCYIENLVMRNCKLLNTTLAFEYSTIDAEIVSHIDSVKNPAGGVLRAKSIGTLILEPEQIDPEKTKIICEVQP